MTLKSITKRLADNVARVSFAIDVILGIHMADAATLAARQLAIEEKEKRRQKQRA